VNPSNVRAAGKQTTEYNGEIRMVTDVQFEVALTSSDGAEGKMGVGVWFSGIGVGSQEKTDTKNMSVTNVRFTIPVAFPVIETKDGFSATVM